MADDPQRQILRDLLAAFQTHRGLIARIVLAVVLVLVLATMFPRGEALEIEYRVGAVWAQRDLIAPFSFPILRDQNDYARDLDLAERNAYRVFERDTLATPRQLALVEALFADLESVLAERPRPVGPQDSLQEAARIRSSGLQITAAEWRALGELHSTGMLAGLDQLLVEALGEVMRTGLLDRPKAEILRGEVAIRTGTVEQIVPLERLYDRTEAIQLVRERVIQQFGERSEATHVAVSIAERYLAPTLVLSEEATRQSIEAARDAVPRTLGFVQENERIVSKHDRITPETKLKLDSFQRAKADRGPGADAPTQILGNVIHVGLLVSLFAIYLALFRPRIVGSMRRLGLIAFIIALIGAVAWLAREVNVDAPVEYLVVLPAASMLLTVFFDSRVGFFGTVTLAFIVGGILGNDYSFALAGLVAGALSVYTVRDMKNRTQIFRSLGFIFLGYALTIIALGVERYESLPVVAEQLGFALGNAVISPVLTYGLTIFLERLFRVTTDLTLLELAQYNHPLLRLLAEKAPGTYHHSLQLATLAEAAAASVGANEVLARVGAYFHDVGKIIKPTYFVENQKGSRNRHDRLAPRMSSLIIAAHVKEGVALAREYKLPEEVIEFIPMHHGTMRIDYFYNKAVELAQQSEDETKIDEINEQDYRYPGPRPQTKETGILMLADGVEAAVRTIDEPTPQRIDDLIGSIVRRRLESGELDECPLTMSDLTSIKAAFRNVLVGVYHPRVKYPEQERKRERPSGRTPRGSVS